jgi:hypothetical protein
MMQLLGVMIGEWSKIRHVFSSTGVGQIVTRKWPMLGSKAARAAARRIREALKSNEMRPNSAATIALKGSNTPLIDTKALVRSIIEQKVSPFEYYGGVDPTATHPVSNIPLWVIAVRQNAGYVINVTPAIRERFRAAGLTVGNNTKFFVVPPRPFLDIGIEAAMKDFYEIVKSIPGDINYIAKSAR